MGTQESLPVTQAFTPPTDEGGISTEANDHGDPEGPMVVDLVDVDNGFNNQSWLSMLWTVRHRWAVASRFIMKSIPS